MGKGINQGKTLETIEDLTPDPRNARRHTQRNTGMLVSSLREVGAARSIVIDENGVILAGNATWESANEIGMKALKVVEVDGNTIVAVQRKGLTEEQKARLALLDNRTAELAEWDTAMLAELAESGVELNDLWSTEELDDLLRDLAPDQAPGAGGDEFDTTPADGPTRVQAGELWRMGDHLLLCGDSTKAEDVARVMQGEKLRMVWTDPPYGVSYADKNRFLNAVGRGNGIQEPIENDHASEEEVKQMATAALSLACSHAAKGASVYVSVPARPIHRHFIDALNDSGFTYKHQLIWVKQHFVLGRSDYHYRHEPILYGWKEDGGHYFVDDHTKDSVFEFDKPANSDLHPTMKPVELVMEMIGNSSKKGEIVYEPFAGSGTTLIACERLGRRCRAIELSPKYCDVIICRWEAESGRQAEKVE